MLGNELTAVQELETTTRSLVSAGKGILAADESHPTIEKRFRQIGIGSTKKHGGPPGAGSHVA